MYISERDVKLTELYRQLHHNQASRERMLLSMRARRNQQSHLIHSSIINIGKLMVVVGLQLQRKPLREEQNLP